MRTEAGVTFGLIAPIDGQLAAIVFVGITGDRKSDFLNGHCQEFRV